MNATRARQLMKTRRQWWEATAEHASEQAMLDSQVNFTFRLALQKIAALDRNEKRVEVGNFERCDRCGCIIEDERLETLLDSESHFCTACASRLTDTHTSRKLASSTCTKSQPSFLQRGLA
jgi:RNA polymerase-binding transcription factor DksA